MRAARVTGRNATVVKYDILTALLAYGLHDEGAGARLAPRLAVLITARFNWQTETLIVGQREIARLWGVTERTAKRELALMRARGWLTVRRPAARGRVTEHGIDVERVLADTRPVWDAVGSDFVARLQQKEPPASNVVPFAQRHAAPTPDGTLWARVSERLWQQDQTFHAAWLANLVEAGREAGRVTLAAPSNFVANYLATHFTERLLAAFGDVDPTVEELRLVAR